MDKNLEIKLEAGNNIKYNMNTIWDSMGYV